MHVLTFFNHAGGASKTSSTRDLGYSLAQRGYRVRLIDCDPQGNLSTWMGIPDAPMNRTIHLTAMSDAPLPEPFEVHGLHLTPAALPLAMVEAQLPGVIGGVTHLRNAVRRLKDQYDFVLLDSPPSLGQLSALAAIAADGLVVPVPTNSKGVQGLTAVHEMIATYRKLNSGLHIAFYLPTQFHPGTVHARESLEALRAHVSPLGDPITYRPAVYPDAALSAMPVLKYAPGSPAAQEIERATDQLLSALNVEATRGS